MTDTANPPDVRVDAGTKRRKRPRGQILPRGKGVWLVRVRFGRDAATGTRARRVQSVASLAAIRASEPHLGVGFLAPPRQPER